MPNAAAPMQHPSATPCLRNHGALLQDSTYWTLPCNLIAESIHCMPACERRCMQLPVQLHGEHPAMHPACACSASTPHTLNPAGASTPSQPTCCHAAAVHHTLPLPCMLAPSQLPPSISPPFRSHRPRRRTRTRMPRPPPQGRVLGQEDAPVALPAGLPIQEDIPGIFRHGPGRGKSI